MSLTPRLTAALTTPPTYNTGMADTLSWVPIDGAGRPLYARAAYITNLAQTNILLSELINEIRQKPDGNGFIFVDDTNVYEGNFQTLKVVADCKISALTAQNSTVGNLTAYELPEGFELNADIVGFSLEYGAVLAHKAVELDRYENSIVSSVDGTELICIDGFGLVTI